MLFYGLEVSGQFGIKNCVLRFFIFHELKILRENWSKNCTQVVYQLGVSETVWTKILSI